jgi:hypothetical protein
MAVYIRFLVSSFLARHIGFHTDCYRAHYELDD